MVNHHRDRAYRYTVPRNNSLRLFPQINSLSLSLRGRNHRQLRFTLDEPRTCRINGTGSHVNYERKPRPIVSETARHACIRVPFRGYRDLNKLSLPLLLNYHCRKESLPSVLRLDGSRIEGASRRNSCANSIIYAQFRRGEHTFLPYSGHRSRFALSYDRGHRVPVALIGAINFPPLDRQFN